MPKTKKAARALTAVEVLQCCSQESIIDALTAIMSESTMKMFVTRTLAAEVTALQARCDASERVLQEVQTLSDQSDPRVLAQLIQATKRYNADARKFNRMAQIVWRWHEAQGRDPKGGEEK